MRTITIILFVAALCGCSDWYLRGTRSDLIKIKTAALEVGAAPVLGRAIRQELAFSGVRVTKKSDAQAVLELTGEEFDRRVLSVDPDTGKVREIELGLAVGLTVRDKGGKLLAPYRNLTWTRDFVFDETALLGTTEQENVIRRELADDAAKTIVLQLEAIDPGAN